MNVSDLTDFISSHIRYIILDVPLVKKVTNRFALLDTSSLKKVANVSNREDPTVRIINRSVISCLLSLLYRISQFSVTSLHTDDFFACI